MLDPKKLLIDILANTPADEVTRDELVRRLESHRVKTPDAIKVLKLADPSAYVKRNPIVYNRQRLFDCLSGNFKPVVGRGAATGANYQPPAQASAPAASQQFSEIQFTNSVVDATLDPSLDKFFPTKSYKHLKRRMSPKFPLNIYVYGETGVGKSSAALHIAKDQGRPAVRVNLSKFADVDELFGGMRIVNGTTYFDKGPVLVAMEMGAVLILDECDSADPTLLTDLHPILEKKGYLIKKLKKMIYPTPGFCVIATANTKGRGDLTGKYIGTSALNRAFLDRFATGIHYESPTRSELRRIIEIAMPYAPPAIVDGVCEWYDQIDDAVNKQAVEDHISPRKILDIIELMMADGVENVSQPEAKECIVEGTNLLDNHISLAFAELWDAMLQKDKK